MNAPCLGRVDIAEYGEVAEAEVVDRLWRRERLRQLGWEGRRNKRTMIEL